MWSLLWSRGRWMRHTSRSSSMMGTLPDSVIASMTLLLVPYSVPSRLPYSIKRSPSRSWLNSWAVTKWKDFPLTSPSAGSRIVWRTTVEKTPLCCSRSLLTRADFPTPWGPEMIIGVRFSGMSSSAAACSSSSASWSSSSSSLNMTSTFLESSILSKAANFERAAILNALQLLLALPAMAAALVWSFVGISISNSSSAIFLSKLSSSGS